MILKEINGNYYLSSARQILQKTRKKNKGRFQFLVKNYISMGYLYGIVEIGNKCNIIFPKRFIGKKVMLRVEFV